jgi:hypothetical protein
MERSGRSSGRTRLRPRPDNGHRARLAAYPRMQPTGRRGPGLGPGAATHKAEQGKKKVWCSLVFALAAALREAEQWKHRIVRALG